MSVSCEESGVFAQHALDPSRYGRKGMVQERDPHRPIHYSWNRPVARRSLQTRDPVPFREARAARTFRQRPGAHTWPYWEAQIQEFFRLTERHLAQEEEKKKAVTKTAMTD